jgi:hypothetical protein
MDRGRKQHPLSSALGASVLAWRVPELTDKLSAIPNLQHTSLRKKILIPY